MLELRTLRGHAVAIARAGEPALNAFVVDSAIDDTAVLRPTTFTAKQYAAALGLGELVTIGAPAENGFLQADVVVQRWTPASRMLLVSNPPALEHLQRRSFRRVPMVYGVRVAIERAGELVTLQGEGIDLSLGGFAASVSGIALVAGEPLAVQLEVPNDTILAVAEVIACTPADRADRHVVRGRFTQLYSSHRPALAMALHEADLARVRVSGGRR